MKDLKDFYKDSWDDMTKYHKSDALEFSLDVWGWWRRLKAKKLKGVMDRSRAYWRKKRQRQRVVRMLRLQRKFEKAMRAVKENANV
uniref:Uncharacterized protein n=1 Tax=viral metagenome TaxID=1070528 RepID=A0A6M3Y0L5_9ZZZZ